MIVKWNLVSPFHALFLIAWLAMAMEIPWCVSLSRWEGRLLRCSLHFLCEDLCFYEYWFIVLYSLKAKTESSGGARRSQGGMTPSPESSDWLNIEEKWVDSSVRRVGGSRFQYKCWTPFPESPWLWFGFQCLALSAIHMTLQASHYLPVRELCQTFNKEFSSAAHFAHL